jgi:hypothetical protein
LAKLKNYWEFKTNHGQPGVGLPPRDSPTLNMA